MFLKSKVVVGRWLLLVVEAWGVDIGIGGHARIFTHFQVTCGSLSWFSSIYLGKRRGNTIFRGALEGVLFLNLRNGLKGVLFLIQVFLIRGEGV